MNSIRFCLCSPPALIASAIVFLSNMDLQARPHANATSTIDLRRAEEQALAHSVEIRNAHLDRGLSNEALTSAWRDFLPAVSVTYRRNRTVARRNFDNGRYSVQLNISQPVYDGGRSSFRLEESEIRRSILRTRMKQLRNDIRYKARKRYLEIQRRISTIELRRDSLKRSAHMAEKARIQFESGVITRIDLEEIRNRHETIQIDLKSAKRKLQEAVHNFCLLTGNNQASFPGIQLLNLQNLEVSSGHLNLDSLISRSLDSHPEIRQARKSLRLAIQKLELARQYYLPRLALTARYGKTGEDWPPETSEWGLGFSLSFRGFNSTLSNNVGIHRSEGGTSRGASSRGTLDLFSDMGRDARILRRKKTVIQLRRRLKNLRFGIPYRAKSLLGELRQKKKQLTLQREITDNRKRQFQVDAIRYENGQLSLEEYREEEMRMNRSVQELARSRTNIILFAATMEKNLGFAQGSLDLIEIEYRSHEESLKRFRSLNLESP
ncbi:MAG: hypothetical protein CMF59_15860 [Leptospiraceae bacterium]|nr:hypothetical protein [Leptospiraceae bacterium]